MFTSSYIPDFSALMPQGEVLPDPTLPMRMPKRIAKPHGSSKHKSATAKPNHAQSQSEKANAQTDGCAAEQGEIDTKAALPIQATDGGDIGKGNHDRELHNKAITEAISELGATEWSCTHDLVHLPEGVGQQLPVLEPLQQQELAPYLEQLDGRISVFCTLLAIALIVRSKIQCGQGLCETGHQMGGDLSQGIQRIALIPDAQLLEWSQDQGKWHPEAQHDPRLVFQHSIIARLEADTPRAARLVRSTLESAYERGLIVRVRISSEDRRNSMCGLTRDGLKFLMAGLRARTSLRKVTGLSLLKVCRQVAEDELADWEDYNLMEYRRTHPAVPDPTQLMRETAEQTGVGLVWAGLLIRPVGKDEGEAQSQVESPH